MQSSPWAVYPRRHLFPNYEEKTQFVWKSIWLNLQEVATCSSVYLQPPNNCVSLQQIKTQINWSGLSESNWFEHIGSLGFPLLSPPRYLPLHLAKYFTWIWPREWQQYLNYLKNISIHELFIRGREDQTLYQESPARNFDMRRLWRHFRPMNFPNINWNKFSSQCYISTAVWLALLFLYFHKLNCGEVNQLFPFHSIFLFGVTWLDIYFMLSTNPWLIQKFPCFRFGNWC